MGEAMGTGDANGVTTELLATRDGADLAPRFVVSLDEIKRQMQDLERFKREIMIEGEDYGVIPGTPKPTLLKPGAEKLTLMFGLAPTFVNVGKVEDWEGGFFFYEEECRLTSKRTGAVVASASGSANTKEAKHRYRKAERVCPLCSQPAIIKGKEQYGGGWLCWKNRGGCGVKFKAGDPEIESQQIGNIENPEPYDLVNTIKKMAQKRALVASVLIATGGSGVWTQDIGEDMPSIAGDHEHEREVIDVSSRQQRQTASPKASMVSTEDNPMWQRWATLVDEAKSLALAYPDLRLPIASELLQNRGAKLRADINAHRNQLSTATDEVRYEEMFGDGESEKQAPQTLTDEALSRNAIALENARALGLKGLGAYRADATWPADKIEEATANLLARVAEESKHGG